MKKKITALSPDPGLKAGPLAATALHVVLNPGAKGWLTT